MKPTKTTRYCPRDLYDAIRRWRANATEAGGWTGWTARDEELYFVMTCLFAPPKGSTLDSRFAIDSYPLTPEAEPQLPPSGEPTRVEWRPDAQ